MREELISSHWPRLRGILRRQWPKLTEDDLINDHGDIGHLICVLQERYDIDRFEAWRQVHEFDPGLWLFDQGNGHASDVF